MKITVDSPDELKKLLDKSTQDLGTIVWRRLRNTCPNCLSDEHQERRNYDMMWGEAELWCGKCNIKIRDMDFG